MQYLCASGTFTEVRAALDVIIQDKIDVQAQLSLSKSDMTAVRGALLRSGEDPRQAQVQATASTDQDWRGRAVRAVMTMDAKIRRLNARITELHGSAGQKQKQPGTVSPRQAVAVSQRTLLELAEFIQSWLDDGWSVVQSVSHEDGVVLVMRNDYPAKAAT